MSFNARFSLVGVAATLFGITAVWTAMSPHGSVSAQQGSGSPQAVAWTAAVATRADEAGAFSPYVDASGSIQLPRDYTTHFVHLGTFALENELHGVYARPEDVRAYRRDGRFPDGAVIIKDVYSVETEMLTTGNSSYAKSPKIWFVMIKDREGRFPDNDLWGDGWGWALFEAAEPEKQIATDYRIDCRTCHVPARADDWLYVRGYPLLRKPEQRKP